MPVDTRLRVKRRAAERERLQAMTMPSAFDGAWTPASDPVTVHTDEQLDGQTVVAGADLESVLLLGTPGAVITDDEPRLTDPAVELGVPVLARVDATAGTLTVLAAEDHAVAELTAQAQR